MGMVNVYDPHSGRPNIIRPQDANSVCHSEAVSTVIDIFQSQV